MGSDFTAFQAGARLMKAAMAGRPARVPVYAQLHDYAAWELGIPARDFYTRPDLLVPALLEVEARYRLDVAAITFDVYNIEAEALGQPLLYSDAGMPDVDRSRPLVCGPEDLGRIKTPDFERAGRFAQVIEMHRLYQAYTGLPPGLTFCAPFSLAANLVGIERLIVSLFDDPPFAAGLFERLIEEVLAPWILYQKSLFPQAEKITGADAAASVPVVNLPILRDWIAPGILRLRKFCGPEVEVVNWVGESRLKAPEKMFDLKLQVGPGCLQGQDPDVERLGPSFYKGHADRRGVPLVLGVGAGFLANSTPAEVIRRVKTYLEAGKPGGRFALYLCNLGANTPAENIHAAVEAVHEYGGYEG